MCAIVDDQCWVYTRLAVLFNPVTAGFQNLVCVDVIFVLNISACERLEIICIADYTYLWLYGGVLFPMQLLLFLSCCHPWQRFLFPCARPCPGARWEMLTPFTMSMGEFVERRPCPKLFIGKAKPLPLGNSLVLVAVGTQDNITARERSSSSERVPACPGDVLDAELSFSLMAPLTVSCVCSLVKVQLLHLPESQSVLRDQGRREVWCRFRSLCRSQPEGIPPAPCVPPRSFC